MTAISLAVTRRALLVTALSALSHSITTARAQQPPSPTSVAGILQARTNAANAAPAIAAAQAQAATDFIKAQYEELLGRDPNDAEYPFWGGIFITKGAAAVRNGIMSLPEYIQRPGSAQKTITEYYDEAMGQDPDAAALALWTPIFDVQGGNGVLNGILASPQYKIHVAIVTITAIYEQLLGRDPDPAGLQVNFQIYNKGGASAVTQNIMNSDEYKQRAGLPNTPFVPTPGVNAAGLASASRLPALPSIHDVFSLEDDAAPGRSGIIATEPGRLWR